MEQTQHPQKRRVSYALVTEAGRQVDGVVEIQTRAFRFPRGEATMERHNPIEVVWRDGRGERRLPMPKDGGPSMPAIIAPVASFLLVKMAFSVARVRQRRRR